MSESPVSESPVALALGSNLGDRLRNLEQGVVCIADVVSDLQVAAVYETAPIHVAEQPPFLNTCCVGVTRLPPVELLARLKAAEAAAGRAPGGPRYGPRPLDLDILVYGNRVIYSADLVVPHPRMLERAFVLVPLAEIAGDWRVPGTADTVRALAARLDAGGVRWLGTLGDLLDAR